MQPSDANQLTLHQVGGREIRLTGDLNHLSFDTAGAINKNRDLATQLAAHRIYFAYADAVQVKDGVVLFVGSSGAGKTTLIKQLCATKTCAQHIAEDLVGIIVNDTSTYIFAQKRYSDALGKAVAFPLKAIFYLLEAVADINTSSAAEKCDATLLELMSDCTSSCDRRPNNREGRLSFIDGLMPHFAKVELVTVPRYENFDKRAQRVTEHLYRLGLADRP
jgi:hypothetical protein